MRISAVVFGAGETARQGRNRLYPDERASHRIVGEHGDGRYELVEHVRELPVRVERHVTGPGTRRDRSKGHRVRSQRRPSPRSRVQDVDLVRAQVDAEHVSCRRVGEDLVRVRAFLAIWIGAGAVALTL